MCQQVTQKVMFLVVSIPLNQNIVIIQYQMIPFWRTSSINQLNFYSSNVPSMARLSGTTAESVFDSKLNKAVP